MSCHLLGQRKSRFICSPVLSPLWETCGKFKLKEARTISPCRSVLIPLASLVSSRTASKTCMADVVLKLVAIFKTTQQRSLEAPQLFQQPRCCSSWHTSYMKTPIDYRECAPGYTYEKHRWRCNRLACLDLMPGWHYRTWYTRTLWSLC
jgi:hypothetical protein